MSDDSDEQQEDINESDGGDDEGFGSHNTFITSSNQIAKLEGGAGSSNSKGFGSHNTFITSSNQIAKLEGGAGSSNSKGKAPK
ncbi:hypothetical protein L1987_13476 [Smallanthus sonchifolius]|uniref:Uncharacterized protein n=1 Tax=Smallanthus sonchifolius TaxID=185202 RepID=A0ACB9JJB1_9ASTR|nr:hypothetical protein L1987_13476 [Smallanthus sonchifolius]